jgi:hypothetical protein
MSTHGFDLLKYGKAVERMMSEWYAYTYEVLSQSSDLGFAREHFVHNILENILPKSVIVGTGEIVDGTGKRSGQQDVIIYRSDFPVITSLTPINTYLIEGVIATIEVKSNLSTGDPNHLLSSFRSSHRVLTLEKQAHIISGNPDQIEKLKEVSSIKTYVIGYSGWKDDKALLNQYISATLDVKGVLPHLVCQPGFCILRNDGFLNPDDIAVKEGILLHRDYPYAVLLHHLLKTIMINTSGSLVTAQGIEAVMNYDLGRYFNFNPHLKFEKYKLIPVDAHGVSLKNLTNS